MTLFQKNNILRVAIIIVMFVLLSSCTGNSATPVPLQATITYMPAQSTNTLEVLPTATLPATPEPTHTEELQPVSEMTSYAFVAVLDYNKHTLDVDESIQYFNTTERELSEIKLIVPPNKEEEVFELTELTIMEGPPLVESSLDGIILALQLAEPLQVGAVIKMTLKYTLTLPYQGGILGYSKKQANFSDWYPFVAPYDAVRGWVINQPTEVGEYLMYDKANFEMTIALTGADGLVVAGSTEVAMLEISIYKMIAINSRGLAFSVSNQYQTLAQQFGSTTVNAYYFAGDEAAAQAAVKNSGEALLLFSTLFDVPYPHATLAVVEVDFPDGMEYDGLYYLSQTYYDNYDGSLNNYLSLLSVHETAHQWWFGIVGNDQANEPWLDEALATYSEYLFIEQYYPGLTDWWWEYRVEYYQTSGSMNWTIYDQAKLRPYINAVYLQGASFMHELRQAMGDEAFFDGLKNYVSIYHDKNASWNDFLAVMIPVPSDATNAILTKYIN